MLLVTAATQQELDAFIRERSKAAFQSLVTGVGMVETATRLCAYLAQHSTGFRAVVNIGIGGAFVYPGSPQVLDICLATSEVLGDFGICHADRLEPLHEQFVPDRGYYSLDHALTRDAHQILLKNGMSAHTGNFVTVHGVSATRSRGDMLASMYDGICENMEGAAVARVCQEFDLPLVELRCISNLVEDRDKSQWKIKQAVALSGKAAALVVQNIAQ